MREFQRIGDYSAVIEKDDSQPDELYQISIFFSGGLSPFEIFQAYHLDVAQSVLDAYVQVHLTQREENWLENCTERMNSGDTEAAVAIRDYMSARSVLAMTQSDGDPLLSLESYLVMTMAAVASTIANLKIELIEQGLIPANSRILEKLAAVETAGNLIEDAFDLIEDMRGDDNDSGEIVH